MARRPPRRMRSRMLKSKRRSSKHHKRLRRVTRDNVETTPVEPIHSLLLSSLRFWEVERDLIEERVAAISR